MGIPPDTIFQVLRELMEGFCVSFAGRFVEPHRGVVLAGAERDAVWTMAMMASIAIKCLA